LHYGKLKTSKTQEASAVKMSVHLESQLKHVAGASIVRLELPEGSSVRDAVRALTEKFGSVLADRLLETDGSLRRSILMFVNNQPLRHDAAESSSVRENDELLLLPPIAGG
jgi:molybdopterin converting factor small subunit